jgi:AcrR family transcriptional regulator
MARREEAKGERRNRILAAAHDLLREIDADTVTVKAIATRSGLSAATIYNLFGSKTVILSQVFDRDLSGFEALVEAAEAGDSLDRIFDSITIAARLYRDDPNFYRLTMVARGGVGQGFRFDSAVREPRMRFWRRLVEAAVAEGALRSDTDAAVVSVLLVQIASGALMDWASDAISVDQLEAETSFGFAAALTNFAVKSAETRLRRRMTALERAIGEHLRAA